MLVGVDLGASRVRAYRVLCGPEGLWAEERAEAAFEDDFVPVPLPAQLQAAPVGEEEERAGLGRVEVIASTVEAVSGGRPCRLAVAAPGLKTADRRGLRVLRYGPRIPRLADLLEARLALEVGALGDDGHLAGWGEEKGRGGQFRDCRNAYLLGAGTGLAQALKREGRVLDPEEVPRLSLDDEDALRADRLLTHPGEAARRIAALARTHQPLDRLVLSQRFSGEILQLLELDCPVVLSALPEAPALGAVAVLLSV